ncbi:hypothetical protein ABMA28_005888 [Loxostege sticticalis]|uniref:Peptidase S1 domain-containing protein n=1 Tax=Loxostege sticticalis TaxID=481309 RepID=A0ABD0SN70_LOXSC
MARRNEIATTIVGGAKARKGDFTHMGAVGWIHSDGSYRWMCGSSLISPRFTITAAHCRNASSKLKLRYTEPRVVRFGSVFLESKDNVTNSLLARDVLIAEFLVLEEYARQPIKKYNDIGLIRLQEEVHATIYIKPACLWTGFLGNDWVANITGWGKTTNTEGSESNHLRYAEVDFVEQSTCKRYIHGRRNRHWSEGLKDHQFCAGKLQGGIDACQGDSGGPLSFREPMPAAMNTTDVVHRVVGITNFGIKCAYPLLPGVYTNVTSFICWIEKNVWPEENNEFCP